MRSFRGHTRRSGEGPLLGTSGVGKRAAVEDSHIDWHACPHDELAAALGLAADADPGAGLDESVAAARRRRDGPNNLPRRGTPAWWRRAGRQFAAPLVAILIAAGVGAMAIGQWIDAAVIGIVVLVNATTGLVQEGRALRAIEALGRHLSTSATVRRNGRWRRIDAGDLVAGDVVRLLAGDRVPADVRLLQARSIAVDESIVTGESEPVEKDDETIAAPTPVADRRNMLWSGSIVVRGRGMGVVVATGPRARLGRIGRLVLDTEVLETPLTRRFRRLGRLLVVAVSIVAVATFLIGWLGGRPPRESFMAAVALAVGAIPEGLPAGLTIILAIGTGRMARRRAIVRRLPAVEALGSTTTICTDKTGTLTMNRMRVVEIAMAGHRLEALVEAPDASDAGDAADVSTSGGLRRLLEIAVLCNDARLRDGGEDGTPYEGDPTEGALLVAAREGGVDPDAVRRTHPRIDEIEFESRRRYMATRHRGGGRGHRTGVKGSVEAVLPRCDREVSEEGEIAPIDRERVEREAERLARRGLRVLAIAEDDSDERASGTPLEPHHLEDGLLLLGLVAMADPPREEAAAAVARCRSAGIRVVMVTGDHAATAARIAKAVGIGDVSADTGPTTLGGAEIDALDDDALRERLRRCDVLARIDPEQKLRVVEVLQAGGEVVAMTGDGVNDAPALRRADIGVAMGRGGSEIAREASDIVLADDRFATIAHAVEEGRGIYGTLARFIAWTLPTNGGEGFVILASVVAGGPLPLLPVQALWVNMSTSVLLGVPLAFDPHDPKAMERPPRDPKRPLLDRPLLLRIGLVSVLLWIAATGLFNLELARGHGADSGRSAAATAHVMGEAFYLFATRAGIRPFWTVGLFANRWLLGGLVAMMIAQWLVVSWPPLQAVMGTGSLDAIGWACTAAAGVAILAVVELEKAIRRACGAVE